MFTTQLRLIVGSVIVLACCKKVFRVRASSCYSVVKQWTANFFETTQSAETCRTSATVVIILLIVTVLIPSFINIQVNAKGTMLHWCVDGLLLQNQARDSVVLYPAFSVAPIESPRRGGPSLWLTFAVVEYDRLLRS